MQLILASNSPRRREILSAEKIPFSVVPSKFEERVQGLSAAETALCFAEGKAREVFSRYPGAYVLGADTVVSLDGEILGKPKSEAEAFSMLRRLSGRTHSVFTGVCLLGKEGEWKDVVETKVEFYPLTESLIGEYVSSGLPFDKAGGYGIQDGYPLVKNFEGSYTNVVGFPIERVRKFFKEAKI